MLAFANYFTFDRPFKALCFLLPAIIVIRFDLLPMLAAFGLFWIATQRFSIPACVLSGLVISVPAICLTVFFDSPVWWKGPGRIRWIWPEFDGLYFNVFLNKSSEWGTQPWHWYLSNAIPRVMNVTFPLMILGLLGNLASSRSRRRSCLAYFCPIALTLLSYSLLPHKELRFILHLFPILNLYSTEGLMYL